jgi:DNA-binding transcriptional LysR family regulator
MSMLTFRLLQVFRQIIDSGSVTAASEHLGLSQPTVSVQLKKISTEVGMPLVELSQGKMLLTEAGSAVYKCAQEILSSEQRLTTQIQALKGIETGLLKIAVVTTAKYVIPPILSRFCKAHPGVEVSFNIGNRAQIVERLKNNMDDLYIFSHPPKDADISTKAFQSNNLYVVAPNDYQGLDHCHLGDIAQHKFLQREIGSGTCYAIQKYCEKVGVNLSNTMTIESNEAIRISVAEGLGLAILSEHTLAQGNSGGMKILDIQDFPLHNFWHAVTNPNRPKSLVCEAFMQYLLDQPTTSTAPI